MNIEKFEKVYQMFKDKEEELLRIKRHEYIGDGDGDVISNFKQIADFEGRQPEEVCLTLILKHLQSVQRAVASGIYSANWYDENRHIEGLWQRISDLRNYLLLLSALIMDGLEEN